MSGVQRTSSDVDPSATPLVVPRILEPVTLPPEVARQDRDEDLHIRMPHPPDATLRIPGPPPSHPRAPLLGVFGKYELIEEIGRGGMGVVYKARQTGLDRTVALKMILSSHLASAEQVDRFYAEARAAAQVDDPNIVAIHDVGEMHGQHYFTMEWVPGPNLAQQLQRGPFDLAAAAHLVAVVARAVDRLHRLGIVHRDLKPSNILLDERQEPHITDFGLAMMVEAENRMTRSGAVVGTPSYMAPEQASGKGGEVGPSSDIYSLGAILYELLTGRPPFDESTPLDTLMQVMHGEPAPPHQLREGIPRALEQICLKCLEKDPLKRYPSAEALAQDLDRFLKGEAVEARREGLWDRLSRWARREPALVSRLSILAIGGAIVQADYYLLENRDSVLNRRMLLVLALGAIASFSFRGLIRLGRWPNLARYAWAAADILLFTLCVHLENGVKTSLVVGYFVLIAASGLWFRERLVWFTTSLALLSYIALVFAASARESSSEPIHRHILFLLVMSLAALIIAYQVKKVRALSYYYDHMPAS
jgi:serine/threonine-protein kinase